jgi:hypothetical protein
VLKAARAADEQEARALAAGVAERVRDTPADVSAAARRELHQPVSGGHLDAALQEQEGLVEARVHVQRRAGEVGCRAVLAHQLAGVRHLDQDAVAPRLDELALAGSVQDHAASAAVHFVLLLCWDLTAARSCLRGPAMGNEDRLSQPKRRVVAGHTSRSDGRRDAASPGASGRGR